MLSAGDERTYRDARRLDCCDRGRLACRALGAHGRRHGRGLWVLTATDGGAAELAARGLPFAPLDQD